MREDIRSFPGFLIPALSTVLGVSIRSPEEAAELLTTDMSVHCVRQVRIICDLPASWEKTYTAPQTLNSVSGRSAVLQMAVLYASVLFLFESEHEASIWWHSASLKLASGGSSLAPRQWALQPENVPKLLRRVRMTINGIY